MNLQIGIFLTLILVAGLLVHLIVIQTKKSKGRAFLGTLEDLKQELPDFAEALGETIEKSDFSPESPRPLPDHKERLNPKWMHDRIGQRVYPSKTDCACEGCKIEYKKGMKIESVVDIFIADMANYKQIKEDRLIVKWFDTKQERDMYDKLA